ncbi:MAG: class I SAM-dependent methyltransferase [Mariprofundaceae bacterium]
MFKEKRISLTEQAHDFISEALFSGAMSIDATAGNGFDTCFLAKRVGDSGHVYAFDVQADALAATREKLAVDGLSGHVTLIHASHALMQQEIPESLLGCVQVVMFNLGYLPGASHHVITDVDETIIALNMAKDMLAISGRISILAYTGHPGGREEADAVREWAQALNKEEFIVSIEIPAEGRSSPPELITIIKFLNKR